MNTRLFLALACIILLCLCWETSAQSVTNAGYVFVPGHGDLGTAQDVAAFREYLVILQQLVSEARAPGKAGAPLTQVVMPALTDAELSGRKRIPQPQPVR